MPTDLRAYLGAGRPLVMLNPGKQALPGHLDGVGAIFVDREGTGLTSEDTGHAVARARSRGLAVIMRSDGLGGEELTLCASFTPDGIVLPQIETTGQLRDAVARLGADGPFVIAQIETVEAVEGLDGLLDVAGVDAFLIGPNDLAAAMGFPGQPEAETVQLCVNSVAAQLREAGRIFGLPTTTPDARQYWGARGAQLLYLPMNAYQRMENPTCT